MVERLTGAFGMLLLAFFAQTVLLAVVESYGGIKLEPFGSRDALFGLTATLSVLAAVARFVLSAPASESDRGASDTSASGHASSQTEPSARRESSTSPRPIAQPNRADRRGEELIEAAARQAIVFRQLFPPPHDPGLRSFFGGAPFAPVSLVWPRAANGVPLHFVLQVDCAAIPDAARLGALPDRGVLYFFLDLSWETHGARVVHCEDASGSHWQTVAPPGDLGPAFGKSAPHVWPWAQTMEQSPVLLPKWPFEPVAIALPENPDKEEDGPWLWPGAAAADLQRVQGGEVRSDYISIRDVVNGPSLRRPFDGFPHDWRAVQICSAQLVHEADRARRYPRAGLFPELDEDAKDARFEAISIRAQQWFDRAAAQAPFDEVPRSEREDFWDFLTENAPLTSHVLTQALPPAIEASLAASAEAAVRVPAALAARLRSRHALAVTTDSGVHVNTPDRMLAPPSDIQGNQWERAMSHVLLLELSSNEGLGHHFAEGVYQLWITPGDLLARRFDRVEITADAY
jgi:hypothetical protein